MKAQFYDGKSPLPQDGTATLEAGKLCFTPDEQTAAAILIPPELITDIREKDQQTTVTIARKGDAVFHQTLLIQAVKLNLSQLALTKEGRQLSLRQKIRQWPLTLKLLVGTLLAICSLSLALFLLFRVHPLVPLKADRYIGNKVFQQLKERFDTCSHPALTENIGTVLNTVVPPDSPFAYEFLVIDDPRTNAFALPGGKVVILSGLLKKAESAEELAGVLAHEAGHVEERHGIRSLIRYTGVHTIITLLLGVGFEEVETLETLGELSSLLVYFKYSRSFEEEADQKAVEYLHHKQLSVNGLLRFFQRIQSPSAEIAEAGHTEKLIGWFSSHPRTEQRIQKLERIRQAERFQPLTIPLSVDNWKTVRGLCR